VNTKIFHFVNPWYWVTIQHYLAARILATKSYYLTFKGIKLYIPFCTRCPKVTLRFIVKENPQCTKGSSYDNYRLHKDNCIRQTFVIFHPEIRLEIPSYKGVFK